MHLNPYGEDAVNLAADLANRRPAVPELADRCRAAGLVLESPATPQDLARTQDALEAWRRSSTPPTNTNGAELLNRMLAAAAAHPLDDQPRRQRLAPALPPRRPADTRLRTVLTHRRGHRTAPDRTGHAPPPTLRRERVHHVADTSRTGRRPGTAPHAAPTATRSAATGHAAFDERHEPPHPPRGQ